MARRDILHRSIYLFIYFNYDILQELHRILSSFNLLSWIKANITEVKEHLLTLPETFDFIDHVSHSVSLTNMTFPYFLINITLLMILQKHC